MRVNHGDKSEDQGLDIKDQEQSSSGEGRKARKKCLGFCINRSLDRNQVTVKILNVQTHIFESG